VKADVVKKFALWSPVDLGYLTMHVAKLVAEGKMHEGTISAGRLGNIKVTGKEVLLGDPVVFTKENIDQYHF
jgi:rhamnose transport system substrate-binding protein